MRKQIRASRDIDEYLDNYLDLDDENLDGTRDLLEMPPDRLHHVYNLEDIDDNTLKETMPGVFTFRTCEKMV